MVTSHGILLVLTFYLKSFHISDIRLILHVSRYISKLHKESSSSSSSSNNNNINRNSSNTTTTTTTTITTKSWRKMGYSNKKGKVT